MKTRRAGRGRRGVSNAPAESGVFDGQDACATRDRRLTTQPLCVSASPATQIEEGGLSWGTDVIRMNGQPVLVQVGLRMFFLSPEQVVGEVLRKALTTLGKHQKGKQTFGDESLLRAHLLCPSSRFSAPFSHLKDTTSRTEFKSLRHKVHIPRLYPLNSTSSTPYKMQMRRGLQEKTTNNQL